MAIGQFQTPYSHTQLLYYANTHTIAQNKCGYKAEFACGFDEAKKIIDEYLGGPEVEEVEF